MINWIRTWWLKVSSPISLLPWSLGLLWQSHRLGTIAITITTLLQGIIPAIQLWITKLLVDQIVFILSLPPPGNTSQAIYSVFLLIILEASVILVGVFVGVLGGHAFNILSEHLSYHIQMRILEHCANLDFAVYESAEYYDYLQRAQEQARNGPILLLTRLLELSQSFISLFSIALLVFLYNAWVFLILTITTIPSFWAAMHYGRQRYFLFNHRTPDGRRATYFNDVLSTDIYAKEVRIWGVKEYLLDCLQSLRLRFIRENIALSRRQSMASMGAELISTLGYYGTYIIVVLGVIAGKLTLGDLTLYGGAFSQTQSLFENVLEGIANVYETQLFVQNLSTFFDIKPKIIALGNPNPIPSAKRELKICDLSFTYPGVRKKVLDGVSFTVRPGECVAIVGINGAGKTTLVKLLLRLYDPTDGKITIDNIDIRQLDPVDWRKQISVVFQDYVRYQMTARENIGFGEIEEVNNLEKICQVAKMVGINSTIENLPDGYESLLGRRFEGGQELSLGQWQSIAVSRALLRDAPILILDEPTAAMDAQAEYELYHQLKALAQNRMTILISHRFSTVRMADRILVLEDGKIIEEGTHEELLAQKTRYAHYFKLQAENYRTSVSSGFSCHSCDSHIVNDRLQFTNKQRVTNGHSAN